MKIFRFITVVCTSFAFGMWQKSVWAGIFFYGLIKTYVEVSSTYEEDYIK